MLILCLGAAWFVLSVLSVIGGIILTLLFWDPWPHIWWAVGGAVSLAVIFTLDRLDLFSEPPGEMNDCRP